MRSEEMGKKRPKVTITVTDRDGEIDIQAKFEPAIDRDKPMIAGHYIALKMLTTAKERTEDWLDGFAE
jgi:hypothetical protein